MSDAKLLFILKVREGYGHVYGGKVGTTRSTGLWNSAIFISTMLQQYGIESRVVQVTDNNDIDREVTAYRPTHVVIEALWVVPEKFDILRSLHPKVKWIIRLHSNTPFIANEGIAFKWIGEYAKQKNVFVAGNSLSMLDDLQSMSTKLVSYLYLPNWYDVSNAAPHVCRPKDKDEVDIGCFGAIRPFKNHLTQAVAAIKFANRAGLQLNFHVNSTVEMNGNPVLSNLIALFECAGNDGHKLVLHDLLDHDEFIKLVSTMDLGLQVSFSETFNIVGADVVTSGVPLVTSEEIGWASSLFYADPNSAEDISLKIARALRFPKTNVALNRSGLRSFVKKTERAWLKALQFTA